MRSINKKGQVKNLSFPLKSAFVNQIQIYEKKSCTKIYFNHVKYIKIRLIDVKVLNRIGLINNRIFINIDNKSITDMTYL